MLWCAHHKRYCDPARCWRSRVRDRKRVLRAVHSALDHKPGDVVVVLDSSIGTVHAVEPFTDRPYAVYLGEDLRFYSPSEVDKYDGHMATVLSLNGRPRLVPAASSLPGVWEDGRFRVCGWPLDHMSDDLQPVPQCMGRAVTPHEHSCTCHRYLKSEVWPVIAAERERRYGSLKSANPSFRVLTKFWGCDHA
jgi:hypothetical protein